jgi:nucleoside 2-deoxyribosyltransferase
MRLYIAGPLFSPYHRAYHAENVQRLRDAGHECFVPQEQEHNAHQSKSVPARVFQVDLAGVRWANALIALLDDPDASSGTACEMGIFYELARHDSTKKGMLGILTDERPRRRSTSNVGERGRVSTFSRSVAWRKLVKCIPQSKACSNTWRGGSTRSTQKPD